jgi:hypothetical protein
MEVSRAGGHHVGERLGNKMLTGYVGRNKFGHHLWMWESDCCGVEQGPSSISHLRRSEHCYECSRLRENNPRWRGHEGLTGVFLRRCQYDAERRGLLWEVAPEYLWQLWLDQAGRCAYTGLELTLDLDASLDRRDNTFGYVEGNVQWVHRDVNRMKTDFQENYFLSLCEKVATYGHNE